MEFRAPHLLQGIEKPLYSSQELLLGLQVMLDLLNVQPRLKVKIVLQILEGYSTFLSPKNQSN